MNTSDVLAKTGKMQAMQPPALNVGMTLREAREQLGMSVHDVAERIKFAPKQVEALEANDFEHLPQATFLRGFVRSYARVLQLDEVALIASLPVDLAKQPMVKTPTVDVAFPAIKSLRRINMMWLAGALGVALVLVLFVLLHDGDPTQKTSDVVESVPLPTGELAASAVSEAGTPSVMAPENAKVLETREIAESKVIVPPQVIVEPKVVPEPVKNKTTAPSVPKIEPNAESATNSQSAIPLEVLKRRPLHLVFGESSWAEVIDAHGVVLLSRNNPRGTEKWVGGPRHAPYDISIARPTHVKLYYMGKLIDLSAYSGTDVAHLKVE